VLRRAPLISSIRFHGRLTLSLLPVLLFRAFPLARSQDRSGIHNNPYKKWLDEDVRWIITDQERVDFQSLSTDKQRDEFIIAFWDRRNPIPGARENAFKQEQYRRLAYANEHFAEEIPGWKTDRGRFYIMYGTPDKVVYHLRSDKPQPDGLQREFDAQEWHWIYIEGLGWDVTLKFVDTCACDEYHLPVGKNELRKYMER
jgi:GWxTD domain-containing protein